MCETCEQLFSPYDSHGFDVLTKTLNRKDILRDSNGNPLAYRIPNADYDLLKVFVLSVLWRASASKHPFFSLIDLGSHADRLKTCIKTRIAPEPEDYGVILFHVYDQEYPQTILHSWRHKFDGLNVNRLYLPDIMAIVKCDQRPFSKTFDDMILTNVRENYLCLMSYKGSSEERYINGMKKQLRKTLKT